MGPAGGTPRTADTTWLMAPDAARGGPSHGRQHRRTRRPTATMPFPRHTSVSTRSASGISSTNPSSRSSDCLPATIAAVFVGGALGTVARYLLEAHHPIAPGGFPVGHAAGQPDRLVRHRPSGPAHRARQRHRAPLVRPLARRRLPRRLDDLFHAGGRRHPARPRTVTSPPASPISSPRSPAGWRSWSSGHALGRRVVPA